MKTWQRASFAVLWLAAVVAGMGCLLAYAYTPGPRQSEIPAHWVRDSGLPLAPEVPTLVMFAHPQCACTKASIGELAILMARCQGRLQALVLFLDPEGQDEAWVHSDLWRSASEIPGVTVKADPDGRYARLFHATTSGQTALYDPRGALQFSGGITASRGHAGDNAGRDALTRILHDKPAVRRETPAFGCRLF